MHAANALLALSAIDVPYTSFGMGSDRLAAAGAELLVDFGELSVIGFVDVLLNYHKFSARLKLLKQALETRKPDLLVLVDFPDFNFKLAKKARSLGIPVLYYISPKFWAWRSGRLQQLKQLVTHMAVIFPFEVEHFERVNVPVTYVGNPLVDSAKSSLTTEQARQYFNLNSGNPTVGLLPGSRNGELQRNLPVMLEASSRLSVIHPSLQYILPCAPSLAADAVGEIIQKHDVNSSIDIHIVDGDACNAMRACDVTICASGTATLENALIGTPSVLVYRISPINYAILSRLIQVADIGLVNIVAGQRIVPELVQHEATGENIASAVNRLLGNSAEAQQMRVDFAKVREKLGTTGASAKVADLIVKLANNSSAA